VNPFVDTDDDQTEEEPDDHAEGDLTMVLFLD
jgi:hypothetical protein